MTHTSLSQSQRRPLSSDCPVLFFSVGNRSLLRCHLSALNKKQRAVGTPPQVGGRGACFDCETVKREAQTSLARTPRQGWEERHGGREALESLLLSR